jgi:DNA-binding MarR family transcriptional regulator
MVTEAVVETGAAPSAASAFAELLAAEAPSSGTVRALAAIAVDALVEGDTSLLETMREGLRRRLGAWMSGAERRPDDPVSSLSGVLRVIEASAQRLSASQLPAALGPGTYAHQVLQAIAQDPGVSNTELRERLGLDETEVSRTGRRLREAGVATRRRFGRVNSWTLSPAGERLLEAMPETKAASVQIGAASGDTVIAPEPLLVSVEEDRATVTAISGNQVLGSRSVEPGLDLISQRLMSLAEQEYGLIIGKRTARDLAIALGPDREGRSGEIKIRGLTKTGRPRTVSLRSSEALAPLLVDGISAAIRDIFEDVGVSMAGRLRQKGAIVFGDPAQPRDLVDHLHADLGDVDLGLSFLMAAELEATRGVRAAHAPSIRSASRASGSVHGKRSVPPKNQKPEAR